MMQGRVSWQTHLVPNNTANQRIELREDLVDNHHITIVAHILLDVNYELGIVEALGHEEAILNILPI